MLLTMTAYIIFIITGIMSIEYRVKQRNEEEYNKKHFLYTKIIMVLTFLFVITRLILVEVS